MPPPDQQHDDRGDRRDGDRGQRGDNRGDQGRHDDRGNQGQRPDDRGNYQGQRPDDHGGYRGDNHGYGDNRGYNGDHRGNYGQNNFRDDRRGYGGGDQFARFHGDPFYYPRGYGYRYFGVGTILPRIFWDQRYYIADPYAYRLPPAFVGTHWVRYGPDALLIRNYDGRIVRVIRGLFY